MFNRDTVIELSKHLSLNDMVNLSCLDKEMNRLSQQDLVWENMYWENFTKPINYYDTYRGNFQLAWKLFHPSEYLILLRYSDDDYQPLCIFNTVSMELAIDKIIEIYNSGINSELNKSLNMVLFYKRETSKIYNIKKDQLETKINKWAHTYLALISIPVYEYPGEPNETSINCFYYTGEQNFKEYGCFIGSENRDEIIDIIGWLLNASDEFLGNDNIFCKEDEDESKKEFKDEFCEKILDRAVDNEDIQYLLDHHVTYDEGIFILKEIPFYKV